MIWFMRLVIGAVVMSLGLSPAHPAKPAPQPPARTGSFVKTDWTVYTGPHARRTDPAELPSPAPEPQPSPAANPALNPLAKLPIAAKPAPRPPARPPVVVGSTQHQLINQDRVANGLPPLAWDNCLAGIAYQNAVRMAAQGAISHADGVYKDLACGIGSRSGENVGYWSGGIDDARLNTMFMNSPDHRANILGPFRYVGTAWVVAANGCGYIAVEFD